MTSPQRLVCGGMAGITSVTFTYPLDIVRTRLSIQTASFAVLGDKPQMLPGMWATLTKMYKTEGGLLALYRGIIPTIAGVAPYVSRAVQLPCPTLARTRRLIRFASCPAIGRPQLHDIRVHAQDAHARGREEPQCRAEAPGRRRLWRGSPDMHLPLVCVEAPPPDPLVCSPLVLTPLPPPPSDVLRRRFQINTMSGIGYQYKSIPDAVRVILTQEGIRGLYKGILPNLLKVVPSMAANWLSFEVTRDFLLSLHPEPEDGTAM